MFSSLSVLSKYWPEFKCGFCKNLPCCSHLYVLVSFSQKLASSIGIMSLCHSHSKVICRHDGLHSDTNPLPLARRPQFTSVLTLTTQSWPSPPHCSCAHHPSVCQLHSRPASSNFRASHTPTRFKELQVIIIILLSRMQIGRR